MAEHRNNSMMCGSAFRASKMKAICIWNIKLFECQLVHQKPIDIHEYIPARHFLFQFLWLRNPRNWMQNLGQEARGRGPCQITIYWNREFPFHIQSAEKYGTCKIFFVAQLTAVSWRSRYTNCSGGLDLKHYPHCLSHTTISGVSLSVFGTFDQDVSFQDLFSM